MDIKYFGFILFKICVSLAYKSPSPEISPNVEEIYLEQNDVLEITCTASHPSFIYPTHITNILPVQISINNSVSNSRSIILRRNKTVHSDTGWYGCVDTIELPNLENRPLTPYNYNNSDVKWIYVYVKSKTNRFVEPLDTFESMHVESGDDVVLPCRPTSPDYIIKLFKDENEVNFNDRITFDPKRGVIIRKLGIKDAAYYHCVIEGQNDQEISYYVYVFRKISYLQLPYINYSTKHLIINGELRMNCSVYIDRDMPYLLSFEIPNEIAEASKILHRVQSHDNVENAVLELIIKNFTQSDEGEYTCTIRTYSQNNSISTNLTLNDAVVEFRKLKAIEMEKQNPDTDYLAGKQKTPYCSNVTELSPATIKSLKESISNELMSNFKIITGKVIEEIQRYTDARLKSFEASIDSSMKNMLSSIDARNKAVIF